MCSLLSVWNYVPMSAGAWGAQRLHQIPSMVLQVVVSLLAWVLRI